MKTLIAILALTLMALTAQAKNVIIDVHSPQDAGQ